MNKTHATHRFSVAEIAKIGLVAAIYVVLTVMPPLNNLAYGPLQFRLSEILNFLPFYNKKYIWGVTLGCFVSNLFSSNIAVVDMVVGTGQTLICLLIGVWLFDRYKKQYFGPFNRAFVYFAVFDAIFGMAIIAAELLLVYKTPFFFMWGTIAAGEFLVLLIGALIIDQLGKRIDLTK
ncbi:MAG: QueT transporter family protein [Lactococcus sp.]|uniref:QueT transporter family protein n=1 Tax=Lactococcus sp. TaxID=44273 RepID=UPI0035AF8571